MACAPPKTTTAPWGSFDVASTNQSTYMAAYVNYPHYRPVANIRPRPQHDWSTAKFEGSSTTADSYRSYMQPPPPKSCKPVQDYTAEKWHSALTTTHRSHFVQFPGYERQSPFKPARKPTDPSKFDTRSTQQDAYPAFNLAFYAKREPIYPKEAPREDYKFDHVSTYDSAYVKYAVSPYRPAPKPRPTMGTDGGMN